MSLTWTHIAIVVVGFSAGYMLGDSRWMAKKSLMPTAKATDPTEALEDCIFVLMKGQPSVMFNTVRSICSREK